MAFLSIDRIEGVVAICEDGNRKKQEIFLTEIEGNPKEGDVIVFEDGKYHISEEETKRRKEAVLRLQKLLFSD